jgi:hypothetical protein
VNNSFKSSRKIKIKVTLVEDYFLMTIPFYVDGEGNWGLTKNSEPKISALFFSRLKTQKWKQKRVISREGGGSVMP